MNIQETIKAIGAKLPGWHFEQYGKDHAIACFPPYIQKPLGDAWQELSRVAPISSVCGPFYVVTYLR